MKNMLEREQAQQWAEGADGDLLSVTEGFEKEKELAVV
jgi:hypothetical protein